MKKEIKKNLCEGGGVCESNGEVYTTYPPLLKCKKCGRFSKEVAAEGWVRPTGERIPKGELDKWIESTKKVEEILSKLSEKK